ncbi:isochorismatase family protein [Gluconacetobacter sacchari]|uniref:isochorismatase family protein n=1 Tax=Gluconacetobacter sacchari TaxID=92759 RepID=UPI0039B57FC6
MQALIIIDMQMDMQHQIDDRRDHVNPASPIRIAALAVKFRQKGLPVLHVRHADENRASPFHPEAAGYRPMPCAEALEDEPVFVKTTSSAFASTDLAVYLNDKGIDELFVTGAEVGFCVNSTVRAGADLGFNMTVVRDAVLGFDMPSGHLSASTIFDVSMALLEGDFAKVVDSEAVLPD